MTRRDFLKGLVAFGAAMALPVETVVMAEKVLTTVPAPPVTASHPLSWLVIDGVDYPIASAQFTIHRGSGVGFWELATSIFGRSLDVGTSQVFSVFELKDPGGRFNLVGRDVMVENYYQTITPDKILLYDYSLVSYDPPAIWTVT